MRPTSISDLVSPFGLAVALTSAPMVGCSDDADPAGDTGAVSVGGSDNDGGGTVGQSATDTDGGDDGADDGATDSPADDSTGPGGTVTTDSGDTVSDADAGSDDDNGVTSAGLDPAGSIEVTLTGCDVDFSGDIVVSYNGSLGVAAVTNGGGALNGSFQFDLDGPATFALSTQHRIDTGTVINMVDIGQGTWTNLDSDSLAGGVDRIAGTLDVSVWSPADGEAVIELTGVTLLNVVNGNVCTIDGTIEAFHL